MLYAAEAITFSLSTVVRIAVSCHYDMQLRRHHMTASGLLSGMDKWLHPEMLNEAKCLMPSSRPRPNLKRPNRTL